MDKITRSNDSCDQFSKKNKWMTRPCCVDCDKFFHCSSLDLLGFCGQFTNAITGKNFYEETDMLSNELGMMLEFINAHKNTIKHKSLYRLLKILEKGDTNMFNLEEKERYLLAEDIYNFCNLGEK